MRERLLRWVLENGEGYGHYSPYGPYGGDTHYGDLLEHSYIIWKERLGYKITPAGLEYLKNA
jgi:hypothetical protein